MANSGRFTSDNQPKGRGKSAKTKLWDAIREEALLDCSEKDDNVKVEARFLAHVVKRAVDSEDNASGTLLKTLMDKHYASVKATMPTVNFEFDPNETHANQAAQIMSAVASGDVPPDVASMFVGSIASMLKISEVTDLEDRIKALEDDQTKES